MKEIKTNTSCLFKRFISRLYNIDSRYEQYISFDSKHFLSLILIVCLSFIWILFTYIQGNGFFLLYSLLPLIIFAIGIIGIIDSFKGIKKQFDFLKEKEKSSPLA